MQKIIRDPAHLAFIRDLPCCHCGRHQSQAAHVRKGTNGGTGIKPGDDWTLPLCHECHHLQHQIGEVAFFKDMDAARRLARNLWLLSGDIMAALQAIQRAKCFLFS